MLTKPMSDLGTLSMRSRASFDPMLPKQNLAVLRSLRRDSPDCAMTIGPMDISFQKSTLAAQSLRKSGPCAAFLASYDSMSDKR